LSAYLAKKIHLKLWWILTKKINLLKLLAKFNQTLQSWSLGGSLSKLYLTGLTSDQDGSPLPSPTMPRIKIRRLSHRVLTTKNIALKEFCLQTNRQQLLWQTHNIIWLQMFGCCIKIGHCHTSIWPQINQNEFTLAGTV
jgi:hypothetical protein